MRRTFIRNAPTYLDELLDPDALVVDLPALGWYVKPLLLTQGDHSPPMFALITEQIAAGVPSADRHVYLGAGHVPHLTYPDDFSWSRGLGQSCSGSSWERVAVRSRESTTVASMFVGSIWRMNSRQRPQGGST